MQQKTCVPGVLCKSWKTGRPKVKKIVVYFLRVELVIFRVSPGTRERRSTVVHASWPYTVFDVA